MVGAAGFEPTTPSPPVKCATRLRYAPAKAGYSRAYISRQSAFHQNNISLCVKLLFEGHEASFYVVKHRNRVLQGWRRRTFSAGNADTGNADRNAG